MPINCHIVEGYRVLDFLPNNLNIKRHRILVHSMVYVCIKTEKLLSDKVEAGPTPPTTLLKVTVTLTNDQTTKF